MTEMNQIVEIKTVDATYRHYEKTVTTHGVVNLNSCRIKWYDIAQSDNPIDASIRDIAQKFLENQAAFSGIPGKNELGFVVLHRCGESFYFLILCTWRNGNELWKTVYYVDAEKTEGFALFPQEEPHKGAFCVWEMGVVTHETLVWAKYLMSSRGQEDTNAYISAQMTGIV